MSSNVKRAANAKEAIEALKLAYGVEADKELAAALGVAPTAVSQWRKRDQVPEKYAYIAAIELPRPVPFMDSQGIAVMTLFLEIYERGRELLLYGTPEQTLTWWAERYVALSWRMDKYLKGKTVPERKAALDAIREQALQATDLIDFIDQISTVDLP